MARYYVTINHITQLPLFHWDAYNLESLFIASDNLAEVKNAFTNVEHISITDDKDLEVAVFTQFDGYDFINYKGVNYSNQIDEFVDELEVHLTKIDLVQQVQRIEDQIVAKNFTYNLEDQSNLLNAIFIIQTLGDLTISLPYHGHAEPCELYNAKDILAIYFTLQFFSTRIQTEINMKMNWITSCETKEEVEVIDINTPLPQEWADRAAAIMGPTIELAQQLQETYFGPVEPIVNEGEESNE